LRRRLGAQLSLSLSNFQTVRLLGSRGGNRPPPAAFLACRDTFRVVATRPVGGPGTSHRTRAADRSRLCPIWRRPAPPLAGYAVAAASMTGWIPDRTTSSARLPPPRPQHLPIRRPHSLQLGPQLQLVGQPPISLSQVEAECPFPLILEQRSGFLAPCPRSCPGASDGRGGRYLVTFPDD
jgi:hypothetical protein